MFAGAQPASKRLQKHQFGVGYSPKTINNHLGVLHRLFEKAIEYEYIERNPVTKRAWMRGDKTVEEGRPWWTPEEEARAFATLATASAPLRCVPWRGSEPCLRLAILTQLVTGIRFGELRALRKEDLDLRAPGLHIRRSQTRRTISTPKNGKARFQVLPRGLADELKVWMMKTSRQLLFLSERGFPLPNNTLNRAYSKLAEQAAVRATGRATRRGRATR